MQVEANVRGLELSQVVPAARLLEDAGVDVIADGEIRRDPLITMAILAGTTHRVGLATAVTIAFARSPMVLATAARNLNELSSGRFSLGLGTQVKRHIERRFGARWSAPGPHLRDYVRAVRDIWRCWHEGSELDHHSEHYTLDLMTPEFDLGPDPNGPIDLAVAAVNRYNLTTAARFADTVRLHPFCTSDYLTDVVLPQLDAAAGSRGRPLVVGGGFIATGADEQEVQCAREAARARIAFYGSTRTYRGVLDHHGWGELCVDLRALSEDGRWEEMSGIVPDEVVDAFATVGTYDTIASQIADRYAGSVDRAQLPCPRLDGDWEGFTAAVASTQAISR